MDQTHEPRAKMAQGGEKTPVDRGMSLAVDGGEQFAKGVGGNGMPAEGATFFPNVNRKNEETRQGESRDKNKKDPAIPYRKLYQVADKDDVLLILMGTAGAVAAGVAFPLFFIFFGDTIDAIGPGGEGNFVSTVGRQALYMLYLGVGALVGSMFEIGCWTVASYRLTMKVRRMYLSSLLRQDLNFWDQESSGALISRSESDLLLYNNAVGEKVGNTIHYLALFAGGFIVGFIRGWKLSLVILAVTPLIGFAGACMAMIVQKFSSKEQESYAEAGAAVEESLSSIRTVASFTGEEKAWQRYKLSLQGCLSAAYKQGVAQGFGLGIVFLALFGSYALGMWYGSERVIAGEYTGGQVLTVFFSILVGAFSLGQISPNFTTFSQGCVAGKSLFDVINRVPVIDVFSEDGLKPKEVVGAIELVDVDFYYPTRPDTQIFDSFSLSIAPGTTVALVGPSGSGKSTIVSLIERFYDPQGGAIKLDGRDIKELNLRWLRQQIGMVSQEPVLFATSILENIMYGKDKASREEVVEAAKSANAHSFISQFPEGYDTQVGEKGIQLSGGQKQRVAIARAMLKDPKILLLDEATSALDAESERVVQDALNRLMMGRTTVVVAHRLSTIRNADQIAVVQKGKLVELGNHKDLIKRPDGAYAELVKLQQSAGGEEKKEVVGIGGWTQRASLDARRSSLESSRKSIEASRHSLEGDEVESSEPDVPHVPLKRVLAMSKPEAVYFALGLAGAVGVGLIFPIYSQILASVIDTFFEKDSDKLRSDIKLWSSLFVALGGFALLVYLLAQTGFGVVGGRLTERLRSKGFASILRQEIGWFDQPQHSSAILNTRLASDASLVRAVSADRTAVMIQNISTIIAGVVIGLIFAWQLTLILLGLFPLIALGGFLQLRFALKNDVNDEMYHKSAQLMSDATSNIRTVHAFVAEDKINMEYKHNLDEGKPKFKKGVTVSILAYGYSNFMQVAPIGLLFYIGALLVENGNFSSIDLFRSFFAIFMSAFAIGQSATLLPDLKKAQSAANSLFAILDRQSLIDSASEEGERPDHVEGTIELRKVDFHYPSRPNVQIFKGFNLTIQSGRTVALVGHSGNGKSTILGLIERFYDPQGGAIMLDGRDIKELNLRWLRQQIGMVSQEPVLFATSILENIMYGKDKASREEVVEAAKSANAHSFISQFPEGYDTQVGEKGIQLSGGQKQRVAIARAMLKDPKILLLDEATSALDAESERVVQDALNRLMMGRTTVVVAHRLSTIRNADQIAVIHKGRLAEQGTHNELVNKPNGAYASLIKLQGYE